MLKNVFLFWVTIMLIMFPMCSVASMDIFYDGAWREYTGPEVTLLLNDIKFEVSEGLMPPIILENRTLVPVREVFETLGGTVQWYAEDRAVEIELRGKKVKLWIDKYDALVDDTTITLDVPAKIVSSKTMVPARFISEKCGLNVSWDDSTKTVLINEVLPIAKIKSVEYKKVNGVKCVVVEASSEISGYKYFSLSEPDRLILDVENSSFVDETKEQKIDDDKVYAMRFGKQENNVNRIVLDLFAKLKDYNVLQSEDKKILYLALDEELELEEDKVSDVINSEDNLNGNIEDENNPNVDENSPNVDENNPNADEVDDEDKTQDENNLNENEIDNQGEIELNQDDENGDEVSVTPAIEYDATITAIKYNSTSDRTRILFDGKIKDYKEFFLENPTRLVVDISNAKLEVEGPKVITPKNKAIKEIEIAQYNESTVRVVFDLVVGVEYEIIKKSSELQIDIEAPTYRNIKYSELENKAELILYDVDIDDLTLKKNKTKKTYVITYSSSDFDTGSGTITTGDKYTKKIVVTRTKITISDKGSISYTARQSGKNVIISINKAEKTDSKIILLDAGHGGKDPGSHNGEYYEKDFNLSIMLKLKEILEDADYTVYTTRTKDVTLTVDDRVGIATVDHPEASLYVSVHNNSVENKNYSGTLIMYCPRDTSEYGITNKQFASYVLEELVDELGTINKGFIVVKETDTTKRVLTEVPMPSILCEVAFVSNDDEVRRLSTDKFQNAAALAIFNGIEKALKDME